MPIFTDQRYDAAGAWISGEINEGYSWDDVKRLCVPELEFRAVFGDLQNGELIVPDKDSLSPENALCLAATCVAAFKNHLITFDDDMRLVLSPTLSEHATGDAFRYTFRAYKGQRMLPACYIQPSDAMMHAHRECRVA